MIIIILFNLILFIGLVKIIHFYINLKDEYIVKNLDVVIVYGFLYIIIGYLPLFQLLLIIDDKKLGSIILYIGFFIWIVIGLNFIIYKKRNMEDD